MNYANENLSDGEIIDLIMQSKNIVEAIETGYNYGYRDGKNNNLKIHISINKHSEGFIDLRDNKNNKLFQSTFGFELPFDIAENIAYALSFGMTVILEDENYLNQTIIKGKTIKEEVLE